jgi:hypothetical protein
LPETVKASEIHHKQGSVFRHLHFVTAWHFTVHEHRGVVYTLPYSKGRFDLGLFQKLDDFLRQNLN